MFFPHDGYLVFVHVNSSVEGFSSLGHPPVHQRIHFHSTTKLNDKPKGGKVHHVTNSLLQSFTCAVGISAVPSAEKVFNVDNIL